ncbi:MAG TPA: hypothetical protein VGN17_29145 [Bryobacteraceae bacterium]|jgi:hypothetical protein
MTSYTNARPGASLPVVDLNVVNLNLVYLNLGTASGLLASRCRTSPMSDERERGSDGPVKAVLKR